jgi:DNA-binding NarL/FixJ family response regulator
VVLADNATAMREVLRSLLAEQPDIDVVGDAADGPAALPAIRVDAARRSAAAEWRVLPACSGPAPSCGGYER